MIDKKQTNTDNFKITFLYYGRARDAMEDIVQCYFEKGYKNIFLPGYIGWSPKEGSGIFDPLNNISGLNRHYYRMTKKLQVDVETLERMLIPRSIVLLVNYFGFRDVHINGIIEMAHSRDCVIFEDNAHGFFTYFCRGKTKADATFFSLHKMFPFETGGGLIVGDYSISDLSGDIEPKGDNPFLYDINAIAKRRVDNYKILLQLMKGFEEYFVPLRDETELDTAIPQTLPILIRMGERNKIYEIMNEKGYGVVSLYHTMIEELRGDGHEDALWLSQRVMNLPVHQDCDAFQYKGMLEKLMEACKQTASR